MPLGADVEEAFPPDLIRYLALVGVVPEARGQGVGRRRLAETLAHTDHQGAARDQAPLRPKTVGFSERHGFAVERAGVPHLPGGPTR